jgi:hypothetical protein
MLSDRRSMYDGWGLSRNAAYQLEAEYGLDVLRVAADGAARFAAGQGRGGR